MKKNMWRYHCFIPVYQQSSWYDLQFLRYRVWQTEIGNCGSKNQKLEKMKKIAGDITILHKRNKNHNHMRFSSLNMEWDRQNFLSLWANFFPFYPPNNKIKIKKKWKKHLEISFHTCAPKTTIIWCMLPEIWNTSHIPYLRKHTSYDCDFWYTCVK